MRILFVSDVLSYGGASKLISEMIPLLVKKGHYCELLILSDKNSRHVDSLEKIGIKINVVPSEISGHITKIKYISRFIMLGKYDVIHANLFPVIYYISIIKRLCHNCPPIVMTEHSTDNKRRHKSFLRPLEQFIYAEYNRVVSISEPAQSQLLKWLRHDKEHKKYSVIENGIDIRHFENALAYSRINLINNCTKDDIFLLMVGSFTPQKNHANMVEALSILPEKYKLFLAGEGPLNANIHKKVSDCGLDGRVAFLGFRDDIAELMHTCDIVVIPSIWEGFGLIAAEAMASGTPIAASDVTGLSEIVGTAAIKFDPQDPGSISNAILKLEDSEMRAHCISAGKARIDRFGIDRLVNEYEKIYCSVL